MTQIIVTVPGVTFDNMLFGDGWQLGELEGWWDTTKPRVGSDPRPEWHGDFGQDTAYLEPRFITVSGVFQSRGNPDLVMSARDVLAALHEAGEFDFTVSDGVVGRVTARLASEVSWDVDYAPGCASFEFTVKADDPRRYGVGQSFGTGVPTPGVGVDDPVLDPVQEGVAVDVATNHAPSLYGPTVPVEVYRNYSRFARNPGNWNRHANVVITPVTDSRFKSSPATKTGAGWVTFPNALGTVVAGDVVTLSVRHTTPDGLPPAAVYAGFGGGTPPPGTDASGVIDHGDGTFTSWRTRVMTGSGYVEQDIGAAPSSVVLTFGDPMVVKSSVRVPYFDGAYSPDPDMTARWIGAANATESVLEGQHPTAFTDNNCVSIIHEVGDGTRELRQIPTNTSNDSFTQIPIPVAAQVSGTMLGTRRQPGTISTPIHPRFGSLMAGAPDFVGPPSANSPTTEPKRWAFGPLTSYYRARFYHGGTAGSGDVYWSKIGLFAGDYTGDWFDGNTQPHDTYIYKWAGVPYGSAAIKQQIVHTPGNPGRIELTNTGTAPAEPMVRVTGGLSDGFELLCIETGSVVRVTRPIPDGSVIDIDMSAGQVWIDQQSPLSAMYVPVAEWFSVKPGATCTIQFTPLGVVTGTPMMTVEFAEASW